MTVSVVGNAVVDSPRTSGTNSSPSLIIKSAPLLIDKSVYCVYAAEAVAGGSTVVVVDILNTLFV